MSRGGPLKKLVVELASALREQVLPLLGEHAGRAQGAQGAGGDITFAIDREAERFLERYLRERAPDIAYYSEDRGLVLPSSAAASALPESPSKEIPVLLVDPVDGTRPALAGLESCCVSVAAAPLGDGHPTMGDVVAGAVVEIKSGAAFVAERGRGLDLRDGDGRALEPALSTNAELSRMFWTTGFRGRPAVPLAEMLEELIDTSSVGGGFFDLGSACFDMTRIATGQLDAYVDVGSRMIDEIPALRERFQQVGGGAVLNNSPYDLAAAALCLQEAGAVVTDAWGHPLDGRPLLGSGHEYQMSCLAASNSSLHSQLVSAAERGIERLRARFN